MSVILSKGLVVGDGCCLQGRSWQGHLNQDFSSFVRLLGDGREPLPEEFASTLRSLRRILRSKLQRRRLWALSPACLGVFGWETWQGEQGESDALNELATDCYTYTFVDRLQALRAQLRVKPNIEGLVFRNVRNFLYDRHKRHDPIGFRVFEVTQIAVRNAISEGRVVVTSGPEAVRSQTVLGRPGGGSSHTPSRAPAVMDLALAVALELLPELVTARGKARMMAAERLSAMVATHLESAEAIAFSELVGAIKQQVRSSWYALAEEEIGAEAVEHLEDGSIELVHAVFPAQTFEDRRWVEQMSSSVEAALDSDELEGRRQYLEKLWFYARGVALEPGWDPSAALSQRKLSKALGIPRERLAELSRELRDLIVELLHTGNGGSRVT